MRSRRSLTLGILLCLSASACAGATAETVDFCESYASAEALVVNGPEEDPEAWAREVVDSLSDLQATAPDELRTALDVIAGVVVPAVQSGDEEALFEGTETEEFGEASDTIDVFMANECEWDSADVVAIEYAFDADLDGLAPGYVGFHFTNSGTEFHEMVMMRINDDTTETIEEILELPEEEAMEKVTFVGATFEGPGDDDVLFADLSSGRYAIFCFLPVGSVDLEALESGQADGPPHFTRGMIKEFNVEA